MSLAQFLSIIRARWRVSIAVLLITFITTLSVSLMLPKQYSANSVVLVDLKSPDPISGAIFQGMTTPAYMATQVDLIMSDRVSQSVIKKSRMNESLSLHEKWESETDGRGSFEAWLGEMIRKGLDAKPSRESNTINIAYVSDDPDRAAGMANAFVQAYIDTLLELRIEPAKQFGVMFEAQAKIARDRLEKAQNKLSTYQREKGLTATDERLDVENARLNELSTQLVLVQSISADSVGRQMQADKNPDRLQDVINNSVISSLKADLSRQDARLNELRAKYGEAHPQVQELNANINGLRAKIDVETKRISGSVGVNNSINQQRELQLKATLDQQRIKVLKLKEERDEAAVLQKDVENSQRAYDTMMAHLTQTSLESQSNQTNVSVIMPASPPLKAAYPKVFLNSALSVLLGVILAIGTAIGMEMVGRRLRTEDDITNLLATTVMGVIPKSTDDAGDLPYSANLISGFRGSLSAPVAAKS